MRWEGVVGCTRMQREMVKLRAKEQSLSELPPLAFFLQHGGCLGDEVLVVFGSIIVP